MEKEKVLEQIIDNYLKSPSSSIKELDLVEELAFIFVDNQFNLNIDALSFKEYVIKSDTLNYVHDFLASINVEYVKEFDYAMKNGKMAFIQNKKKKREQNSEYEVIASYQLKDSFDLVHYFFEYWMKKNAIIPKEFRYFIDTFSILAEFLFQDYLESLELKSKELYYSKMNHFIYTNIFTVHMIVELKLIELYQKHNSLEVENSVTELEESHISTKELLSTNCQIIIDDILSMNGISLPFHKRYLYGIMFASFIHQRILERPTLIRSFCYLIDNPEPINVYHFMNVIGIPIEEKDGMWVLSRVGYQSLKQSFITELEDTFIKNFSKK